MRRRSFADMNCSVAQTLDIVGDPWTLLIVRDALFGYRRFDDFVERLGTGRFEEEVRELTMPAEFGQETMQEFVDWSREEKYKVERGEGECAV